MAKKNGEKKVTEKTLRNYEALLGFMQPNVWYKATELIDAVSVKESRLKALLADLVEQGVIEVKGSTKGKVYKKIYIEE